MWTTESIEPVELELNAHYTIRTAGSFHPLVEMTSTFFNPAPSCNVAVISSSFLRFKFIPKFPTTIPSSSVSTVSFRAKTTVNCSLPAPGHASGKILINCFPLPLCKALVNSDGFCLFNFRNFVFDCYCLSCVSVFGLWLLKPKSVLCILQWRTDPLKYCLNYSSD